MTKKKNAKTKNIIIISTLFVLVAIFIIGYGIGLILGDGPKKSQADNSTVDLSKKSTEQISEGNNDLDKSDSESNENNEKLDKEDTESNEDNKTLDNENNVSNKDDKDTKEKNENDKDIKQESDNTKSGQDQTSKDVDGSKLTTKEIWDIYNEGNRLYKQGNYEKALPKLQMSYKIKPDASLMPWLTYQLGDSYKELNDNANALVYFKKVIKNYPSSQFVSSAERMIKEIESK
ncbi:tetratricopeptide repeat protein [Clostridium sp. HMP27]|uniref:tetratricopeptide repeat protein n=1 Tax=Clostridium sp. HMP27 TaxID=1487921 RepID=UPI00052C947F|nr:tetratricopeptide repeat protein [Clostridium sp. HMP27]KGK86434.1 hypothetical protein DP68_13640 [Clostridium sp. HMP27]